MRSKPVGFFASTAFLVLGLVGCTSAGSSFDMNGGSTGTGSGGSTGVGSGGSIGSGGSGDPTGSGGDTGGGGDTGTGSGGSGIGGDPGGATGGSGLGGATGSGGSGTGSGGSGTNGSGGSTTGTGGRVGTGGTTGTGGMTAGTGGATAACPKPAGQICHEFIANDNSRNQVNYVDEFNASKPIKWTTKVGDTGENSPRSIEIVDNTKAKTGKAVLVSTHKGYVEIDLQDGTVLGRVATYSGVTSANRLPDGNTALGTLTALVIVNAAGAMAKPSIMLPPGSELRTVNRNPADGTFWLAKNLNPATVYNITSTGMIAWEAKLPAVSKGYAVWWRPGGGAFAATGEPATIVEIDQSKTTLKEYGGEKNLEQYYVDWFSGFNRLPNGNFVVASWLGHKRAVTPDSAPHVLEITPDNKVVWTWGNRTLAEQITNIHVFR